MCASESGEKELELELDIGSRSVFCSGGDCGAGSSAGPSFKKSKFESRKGFEGVAIVAVGSDGVYSSIASCRLV